MIEHLQEVCDRILDDSTAGRDKFNVVKEILGQLQRLDPLDFEQAKRADFMMARGKFEHLVSPNKNETVTGGMIDEAVRSLRDVLPFYSGEGTHLDAKPFSFLRHADLIDIIKRDYRELWLRLHPSRAWKSSVVLAGSILEAILYDVLSGPKNEVNANAYVAAHPRYGGQGAITGGRWTLQTLIDSALNLNLLRNQDGAIIHQTLRDYRNFIHPMKELRASHSVGPNEAGLAVNSLNTVIDHLEATFTP